MSTSLLATVLTENTPTGHLVCEHGLSVHLCYRRERHVTNMLLDFGQSNAFACNAEALGIDLTAVDLAVLSHAHYDHADGMPAFFARNTRAPLYLSEACDETCWSTKGGSVEAHYIGIGPGLLERYAERLTRVTTTRSTSIAPGVHLMPHTTPGLSEVGRRAGMLLRTRDGWMPDPFAHELSLVVELEPTEEGTPRLAVFNSCSHAGLPVIVTEVIAAFPGAHIATYVGGLHLVHAGDAEIARVAEAIRAAGIDQVCTGHCTGPHALDLLRRTLPGRITTLAPGMRRSL